MGSYLPRVLIIFLFIYLFHSPIISRIPATMSRPNPSSSSPVATRAPRRLRIPSLSDSLSTASSDEYNRSSGISSLVVKGLSAQEQGVVNKLTLPQAAQQRTE
jgi:hypothetical protein